MELKNKYSILLLTLILNPAFAYAGLKVSNTAEDTPETNCLKAMSRVTHQNYQEITVDDHGKKKVKLVLIDQSPGTQHTDKSTTPPTVNVTAARMNIYDEEGGKLSIDGAGTGCNKSASNPRDSSLNQAKDEFETAYNAKLSEFEKKNNTPVTTSKTKSVEDGIIQKATESEEQKAWAKSIVGLISTCKKTRYYEAFGLSNYEKSKTDAPAPTNPAANKANQ